MITLPDLGLFLYLIVICPRHKDKRKGAAYKMNMPVLRHEEIRMSGSASKIPVVSAK